jgi:hypothetical protein
MKARWTVLMASILVLFAAACGGSDKGSLLSGTSGSSSSSSSAPVATAGTSQASDATSASRAGQMFGGDKSGNHSGSTGSTGDKPAALGDTFKSTANKYSVQYPKDWTAKANAASLGGTQIDGFLSPDTVDGFTTNVNILCDTAGAGETVDDYLKENLAQLQQQKITAKDAGKAQTASGAGKLVTYTTFFGGTKLDFAQIAVTDKRCGWVLTLTTPEGQRDKYLKTFLAMAATFKAN